MKLLTPELEEKFAKTPLYSTEGQGMDAKVLVKYFNPYGRGTWLITEAQKQENGDYLLFGYCHIFEWEWGYVLLSELQDVRIFGELTLERDLYAKGTVRELYEELTGCSYDVGDGASNNQHEEQNEER